MKNTLRFTHNRLNTDSVKWDLCDVKFKRDKLLPMWVADMDISTARPVVESIQKRARSGAFGYTYTSADYKKIVKNWIQKQNNWKISPSSIYYAPGVGSALYMLVRAFSKPGDNIIVQTPVYYVFFEAIKNNERNVVENQLKLIDNRYEIDFEDLEAKLKTASMIILSSPHNPVGRVWTQEELKKIGELCIKYDVKIISDEVHSDLTLFNNKFTSMANISKEISDITITCTSPSKAFNLAGLQLANIIIENKEVAKKYEKELQLICMFGPNSLASEALKAAYTKGEGWLNNVKSYFEDMTNFIDTFLKENCPKIKLIQPESTYLLWLDCCELGLNEKELDDFIFDQCKLGLDPGHIFGESGSGFMRINIATSRETITKALTSIHNAYKAGNYES